MKKILLGSGALALAAAGYGILSGRPSQNLPTAAEAPLPGVPFLAETGKTGEGGTHPAVPEAVSSSGAPEGPGRAIVSFSRPPVPAKAPSSLAPAPPPLAESRPAPGAGTQAGLGGAAGLKYVVPRNKNASGLPTSADLPLVLYQTPAGLNLTSAQEEQLNQLAEDFIEQTGAADPQQNPEDPVFANRWRDETFRANERLRAMLGWEAFNRLSLAASGSSSP